MTWLRKHRLRPTDSIPSKNGRIHRYPNEISNTNPSTCIPPHISTLYLSICFFLFFCVSSHHLVEGDFQYYNYNYNYNRLHFIETMTTCCSCVGVHPVSILLFFHSLRISVRVSLVFLLSSSVYKLNLLPIALACLVQLACAQHVVNHPLLVYGLFVLPQLRTIHTLV